MANSWPSHAVITHSLGTTNPVVDNRPR
jgi:hypothetical protein